MPLSYSYVPPKDLKLVQQWEQNGLVERAKPEKASLHQFDIFCGDPRRPHMYQWLSQNFHAQAACCDHSADPMIVQVPYFGGAMALGLGNPVSPDDYIWRDFIQRFTFTQEKLAGGKIQQINMVQHSPCRMSAELGIDLEASIPLVLMGKARIKFTGLVPHVAPLLWLDIGPNEFAVWRMKLLAFVNYFRAERPHFYRMIEDHRIRLLEQAQQERIQLAAD